MSVALAYLPPPRGAAPALWFLSCVHKRVIRAFVAVALCHMRGWRAAACRRWRPTCRLFNLPRLPLLAPMQPAAGLPVSRVQDLQGCAVACHAQQ